MTYNNLYVKDAYINTTIYDDSAVTIPDAILPKRLTILQPIFSSKGKSNVILDFSSSSLVKDTYGSDMENLDKYGQGGMNLIHAMGGGASAQVCRLLPDTATVAGALVSLRIEKVEEQAAGEETEAVIGHLKTNVIVENGPVALNSVGGITTGNNVWTIPLFKLMYNGAGLCGNNVGFTIENDLERDGDVIDGRRYILTLYEKDKNGNATKLGDSFYFSLNPEAVLVQGTEVMENLQYVFGKKDSAGNERPVICTPFIMDNYEALSEIIAEAINGKTDSEGVALTVNDIDVLNCLDKDGNKYAIESTEEAPAPVTGIVEGDYEGASGIGKDVMYFLGGGSDGDLQLGYTYTKTVNGVEQTVTVDQARVDATKKSLLTAFFKGQIDPAVFDERMVTSDIVFDANYDFEIVKPVMLGKFRDIRPDIMVIADIGTEAKNCAQAMSLIKAIYGLVDGSKAYTAAVIAHAGYTTDRTLNKHVTGTYDYAYGLAKCYGLLGTFSVFAGYQNAKVETMEFDWLPYKDENDTMIGPLRKLGCIFAFKIDRQGTVAYMAEENMYTQTTSKLKSIRNGMVIGDAVRLGKAVLIKYVYDNEGATGAIRKASSELAERLSGRYPSNIAVTADLYQSERDKLLETSTCDLTYYFPGMTKGWKLNIYAKRGA